MQIWTFRYRSLYLESYQVNPHASMNKNSTLHIVYWWLVRLSRSRFRVGFLSDDTRYASVGKCDWSTRLCRIHRRHSKCNLQVLFTESFSTTLSSIVSSYKDWVSLASSCTLSVSRLFSDSAQFCDNPDSIMIWTRIYMDRTQPKSLKLTTTCGQSLSVEFVRGIALQVSGACCGPKQVLRLK